MFDVDVLEEIEVLDTRSRAPHFGGVECVAFYQSHLAPDHLVDRADVAGNVNPLDKYPRAFADIESYVNLLGFAVSIDAGTNFDESEAFVADRLGQVLDRILAKV